MNIIFSRYPELQKSIWLELTPSRLILLPLFLASIFLMDYIIVVYLDMGNDTNFTEFLYSARKISTILFIIFIFIWGNRLACDSILNEVNEKTWDFQRMTSISPWNMAIGKLFGSTISAWYGAMFCIFIYTISSFYLPETGLYLKAGYIMILCGLLSHALSIGFSLYGIKKSGGGTKKINTTFFFLAAMVISFFAISSFVPIEDDIMRKGNGIIKWFSFRITEINFLIASLILFLTWALTGLYRNMRSHLQIKNGCMVWIGFELSLMAYIAGFTALFDISSYSMQLTRLMICFGISFLLSYMTLFGEPKNIVDFRKLSDLCAKARWKEIQYHIPLWLISVVTNCVMLISICCLYVFYIDRPDDDTFSILFLIHLFLFLLRDISLVLYVNIRAGLGRKANKADITAVFYLLILYILIPSIIKTAHMDYILPALIPDIDVHFGNGLFPVFIQFVFILCLLAVQWEKIRLHLNSSI